MKNFKSIITGTMFAMACCSTPLMAGNKDGAAASSAPPATEQRLSADEIQRLESRYNEIQNTDTHNMSRAQKQELKNESNTIQSQLSMPGTVIYISGGVLLILIIILVIVLL